MPYLVDGNNLAHALGLATKGLADRDACARTVAEFCRTQGAQATIVFDGPPPEGAKSVGHMHKVRVIFSEARSADDTMLRMLSDSKTPRDFTVVTSDKSLGDKARHLGAALERSHEFARRLDRPPHRQGTAGEKQARRETPDQINAWLSVFDPGRKKTP
ncbi:MAG: NYN domain-containing protein [Vicinamibacteria bacterium]